MIHRYHSRAHYVDLSPTSPLWPSGLLLASILLVVTILLQQELPFAIGLTHAITRVTESCPGYTPSIQPDAPSVDALNLPESSNPIPNGPASTLDDHRGSDPALLPSLAEHRGPPLRDRALWRTGRRRSHLRSPRS